MKRAGEILKDNRLKKAISLKEVSEELKIHIKFLEAIEESNYSVFSDTVQIKGFIKNYARFLGLKEEEVMAFWRREYEEKDVKQAEGIKLIMKPMFAKKIFITPGTILFFITLISIIGFLGYLFYQYRSFAGAPFLAVESPSTDLSINELFVDVFGKIDKDAELFLNGQRISMEKEGSFAVKVTLSEGVNVLNFKALNKLGREAVVTRTILANVSANQTTVLGSTETVIEEEKKEEQKVIKVEIEIIDEASWINVVGDGETLFQSLMLVGVKAQFSARDFITIKAGNAGAVKVFLEGKDMGVLGEKGTVVEKTFK
ncbi:MAG: RodZ domain-containing protein [bacterium]